MANPLLPVVVYSHLRWNFVYQRPQHILSRLARSRRVLFVEEPVPGRAAELEVETPTPGVTRVVPHTTAAVTGFTDNFIHAFAPRLERLLIEHGVGEHVAWLYTPIALPLARALEPWTIVYDCMDELAAFAGAPPNSGAREAELLAAADAVFTGGPSLHRAKKDRHWNVHCFPSSVDVAHFRRALEGIDEPADQAELPHPRLGFFGVIDERLDRDLVSALAAAHPEWQIVMIGPVVKIDPAALPRHPNLHYLGQRDYESLPAYLGGWDVCLLPFARNDATKFISPTKTLEYMAAEKPIVSTPIRDVVEPYADVVAIGDDATTFIAACERALAASPAENEARIARTRELLATRSWDATVAGMAKVIAAAVTDTARTTGAARGAIFRAAAV